MVIREDHTTPEALDWEMTAERALVSEEPTGRFVATINVPGYLPECDPVTFATAAEAWAYLADERQRDEDSACDDEETYSDAYYELKRRASYASASPAWSGATGAVSGSTPGRDSEHDLGLVYVVDYL